MKITLVQPPVITANPKVQPDVQPPLGVAYIAASLRQGGHTVRVVDGLGLGIGRAAHAQDSYYVHGLPVGEIVERVDADSDVIGVATMFSNFWPLSKTIIRALRLRFPHTPIICGGEHVTALSRFVVEDAPVDYAVVGEGEETALELVAALGGAPGSRAPEQIAGLTYRAGDGHIVSTPRRQRRRALGEIPWPAWDLFPLERYLDACLFSAMPFSPRQRPMIIMATRGCPYTCKFCSNEGMWGINYFVRDPTDVVDEMQHYVETYGATDFHFQDLTLIINRRWALSLCDEIIERRLGITWKTALGTRSEALDRELLAKMAASGCDELILAPESGSPEMGRTTRKKVKLDKVLSVARTVRDERLPMRVTGLMIIGYPEERLSHVLETYRFMMQMARAGFSTVCAHRFTAYPGCEYHDIAVAEGRIVHGDAYFLSLENRFPYNSVSWHPRWSGRFILFLITIGYALFFGTYYLSKPTNIIRALRGILGQRPASRFERYFAYRLWGSRATTRAEAGRSGAPVANAPAVRHERAA